MNRRMLYFWLALIALSNSLVQYYYAAVELYGLAWAVLTLLNLSAIVWIAVLWPLRILFELPSGGLGSQAADQKDYWIATLAIFFSILPWEYVGWLGVFVIGVALAVRSRGDDGLRRAGVLLFSVTIPQFWSKIVFSVMSQYILPMDAALVSSITGTKRFGNLVEMPAGSGFLQIAGPCSSFGNVSLAFTGWMIMMNYYNCRASNLSYAGLFFVIISIIFINTIRISLIGFFPQYYHILHDQVGNFIVSWLIVFVIVSVASYVAKIGNVNDAVRS